MKAIQTLFTLALVCSLNISPTYGERKKPSLPENHKLDVIYKTVGEYELALDLYYPDGELKGEYPIVLYTHGGGWSAGSKNKAIHARIGAVNRGLLKNGFCVAAVQYRLVGKFGKSTMRDCVIDAKDALRFLAKNRKQYHANPDQVFTFGDSAGGHIAQMILLSPPESLSGDSSLAEQSYRVVAGLSWYGPCDFEKVQLFNHDKRKNFRDRFGPRILEPGAPIVERIRLKLYREMSPINYLSADSAPLLMIQGDGDTTIPVDHAHYMAEKAQEVQAPVETMIIKNAGHNWRMADGKTPISPSQQDIIAKSISYLTQHLQ